MKQTLVRRLKPGIYDSMGLIGIAFLALVFLLPLMVIFAQSVISPSPENFVTAITGPVFQRALIDTIVMALWVTLACVVIGYPYAYVMARSGMGMMTVLLVALMLSFWTSTLVRTYAWQVLLNDTGIINSLLLGLGIIAEPLRMIRTDFAVYLGMAHVLAPFAILPIFAQIRSISPDLEQAAQIQGATRAATFFRITLPLSLPGAAAGGILVFVTALGFYITPQILGDSKKLYVGSAIVQQLQVFVDIGVGSAMAIILLGIVIVTLAVTSRVVGLDKVLGITRGKREL